MRAEGSLQYKVNGNFCSYRIKESSVILLTLLVKHSRQGPPSDCSSRSVPPMPLSTLVEEIMLTGNNCMT